MGFPIPDQWKALLTTTLTKLQHYYPTILFICTVSSLVWIASFTILSPNVIFWTAENYHASAASSNYSKHDQHEDTTTLTVVRPLTPQAAAIVNATMRRLEIRVQSRLANKTLYQARLNQTKPWNYGAHVYVTHGINDGGLGNWMFMIASLYGVARSSGRLPTLLQTYWAEDYFNDFSLMKINKTDFLGGDDRWLQDEATVGEIGAGKFAYWMPDVNYAKGAQNVILSGYLQSWMYFKNVPDEIRSLFTFRAKIYDYALGAIWSELGKFFRQTELQAGERRLPRLIGIHVRRGDILIDQQRRHGHEPATEEYFQNAITYFRRKYSPVLFLVVTNDDAYAMDVFHGPDFMFLEVHHEAVDMALLSLMDDLVLSVGSYGWWAAYLSDAEEVLYYKNWPRPGTAMARGFNTNEYFYPSWTAME